MAYLYRHIRLDTNQPFYIGVGRSKYYKRAKSSTERNKLWKEIVSVTPYEVEIIMDNIDIKYALEKEKEFIRLYGRLDLERGTLTNLTDGGMGHCGYINSEETIQKKKKSAEGKIISSETRKKMAAKLRGRPQPQWQRDILSKAAKGKKVWWCFKPILQLSLNGDFIKEFESIAAAAKCLKLQSNNIGKVLKGERNHCGGFVFKYR